MNSTHTPPFRVSRRTVDAPFASSASVAETLHSRFALRLASRLTEGCESISPDISERLRFAREQALQHAQGARGATASSPMAIGRSDSAVLGGRASGWRLRFAGMIPVLALVGGLVLIQHWQDNAQVAVAAEIDAALLSDDLPPTAYSDAGFVEFLKTPSE